MRRQVAAFAVVVALSGACSDDDDGNGGSFGTAPSRTTATTAQSGSITSTTAFAGDVTDVSTPPTEYRYLKAVRLGSHAGFDRIVFEFESGVPGYAVKYVNRPITEDGSGKTVQVSGGAVLSVRMEAASGADLTNGFRQTYTGSTRIKGTGPAIQEAVRTGDFEAVLNWVVGVTSKRPFHAYTSEGNKLIVDVGK